MGSRTFAIAAAAAVALAGYAVWTTMRPRAGDPGPTKAAANGDAAEHDTPARSPRGQPAAPKPKTRPRRPKRGSTSPAAAPQDEPAAETGASPPPKTAFDFSRQRFDDAARELRNGPADPKSQRALLEQAKIAVKDMEALLDEDIPSHRRDVTRSKETLVRLQARFGE
ncbi:MAG: hypothetical protein AAF721_14420 [Myxococcota bacterium]